MIYFIAILIAVSIAWLVYEAKNAPFVDENENPIDRK